MKKRYALILTFSMLVADHTAALALAAPGDKIGPPTTHQTIGISLPGKVAWLLALKGGKKDTLLALMNSGVLYRIAPAGGKLRPERLLKTPKLSVKVPPIDLGGDAIAGVAWGGSLLVIALAKGVADRVLTSRELSPLSRPVFLSKNAIVAAGRKGSLILFEKKAGAWREAQKIPGAQALGDSILTAADIDGDRQKELIVLAAPTERYGHGVLGDAIEPSEIRAYKLSGGRLGHMSTYQAGGAGVFEALGTLAADIDGDGREEILVTRSDDASGAAHLALSLRGGKLLLKAAGTAIGMGNRWSHLLGVHHMGKGKAQVLAIETPHLAGYLLALEQAGDNLSERARRPGFSTHTIGSRNLWQHTVSLRAGAHEIVVPKIGGRHLAALALKSGRWVSRWTIPLASSLASNLVSGAFNEAGRADLAFADEKGAVRMLLSK